MDCCEFCKQPETCQDDLCINKDEFGRSNPEPMGLPHLKIDGALIPISLHLFLSASSHSYFSFSLIVPNSIFFTCRTLLSEYCDTTILIRCTWNWFEFSLKWLESSWLLRTVWQEQHCWKKRVEVVEAQPVRDLGWESRGPWFDSRSDQTWKLAW